MTTLDQIKAIIADQAGIPAADVGDSATFSNLGLDSLDRLELAMKVGDHFGFEIPDDDVNDERLGTAAGLAAYVDRMHGDKPQPARQPTPGVYEEAGNIMSGVGVRWAEAEAPITREEVLRRGVAESEGMALNVAYQLGWPTEDEPKGRNPTHALVEIINPVDYAGMNAGDMMTALGMDGMKWADAFMQIACFNNPLGRELRAFPHGDRGPLHATMLGWFCNAIMAGYDHAKAEEPSVDSSGVDGVRFRKKPVEIEAVQFLHVEVADGSARAVFNRPDLPQWLLDAFTLADGDVGAAWVVNELVPTDDDPLPGTPTRLLRIGTLEGSHLASEGDWIIRGVAGEIYPCKPAIFAATYDAVDEAGEAHEPL